MPRLLEAKNGQSPDALQQLSDFDLVLAMGLVHHLNNQEATKLFSFARKKLKDRGRLITFDGCYVENQSSIARFLLKHDRGQYVRTQEGYEELARDHFLQIETTIFSNLIRIPYTLIVMECAP